MRKEKGNMRQEQTFSGKVKEELAKQESGAKHCQLAEIAAIIGMCGKVAIDSRERFSVKVRTENISVARKFFTLLKKTFNIKTEIFVARNKGGGNLTYTVIVKEHEDAIQLLQACELMDANGEISGEFTAVHRTCCLFLQRFPEPPPRSSVHL